MFSVKKYFWVSFLIFFSINSIVLASGYDQYFVTVDWLKQNLDKNIVIIDARGDKAYKGGHIPGALPVSWKQLSDMSPEFAHRDWGTVTDKNILTNVISSLGITAQSEIIIYSDTHKGWGEDGRIFWTFKIAGLSKLKILDGGIRHWKKQGGKLSKKIPYISPGNFIVKTLKLTTSIKTDDLIFNYDNYKIIDARTEKEFKGAIKFREKRGGHLPGAILLPYKGFLDNGLLKPVDELKQMLQQKNIQQGDNIVTYCTGGIRSAYVQVVMEMLGFNHVQNYDESFWVWANDQDTSVEVVVPQKQ